MPGCFPPDKPGHSPCLGHRDASPPGTDAEGAKPRLVRDDDGQLPVREPNKEPRKCYVEYRRCYGKPGGWSSRRSRRIVSAAQRCSRERTFRFREFVWHLVLRSGPPTPRPPRTRHHRCLPDLVAPVSRPVEDRLPGPLDLGAQIGRPVAYRSGAHSSGFHSRVESVGSGKHVVFGLSLIKEKLRLRFSTECQSSRPAVTAARAHGPVLVTADWACRVRLARRGQGAWSPAVSAGGG